MLSAKRLIFDIKKAFRVKGQGFFSRSFIWVIILFRMAENSEVSEALNEIIGLISENENSELADEGRERNTDVIESVNNEVNDIRENESGEQEWDVEMITGIQQTPGKSNRFSKYQVKWLGFARKTWEPFENLKNASRMVHLFHERNPRYGRSPIPPHLRKERYGRARTTQHNEEVWLAEEEIKGYLAEKFESRCHIFDAKRPYELKDGINATIIGLNAHAFVAIILKNYLGFERKVLVGDALNSFAPTATEQRQLVREMMNMLEVDEFEVILHQPQIHVDTCAYAAIVALEETLKRLEKVPLIPVLITYPHERIKNLMRIFGRDHEYSKGVKRGRFEGGSDLSRSSRCSYCMFECSSHSKHPYQSKCQHEKIHKTGEFKGYKERPHIILKR